MPISSIRVFSRNTICNCVHQWDSAGLRGELHCLFSNEPVRYRDVAEMLVQMEAFYDRLRFPMASTEARSFGRKKLIPRERNILNRKENPVAGQDEKILSIRGQKGTFLIQVQYRQNATWQGRVFWAEEGKSQSFRSALELIRLIDEAMTQSGESLQAGSAVQGGEEPSGGAWRADPEGERAGGGKDRR